MKPKSGLSCFAILILIVCLLLAGAAAGLFWLVGEAEARYGPPNPSLSASDRLFMPALLMWQSSLLTRPADSGGVEQQFVIEPGEPTANIIGRLWEAGLVRDPGALRTFLQYTGLDTGLQSGAYQLSPAMTPIEIAYALQETRPGEAVLTIFPGWRLEEIAAALPTSGLQISPEQFILSAQSVPSGRLLSAEIPPYANLEGFLLPGAYNLPRTLAAPDVLALLLNSFEAQITTELRDGLANQGLSLYQGVIVASIVEREAVVIEEQALIASVYLNRLAIGMKLDADPTVQYALDNPAGRGWWPAPLSLADLQFDSPYNTYLYAGLPPGPIGNPSSSALRAVAFPAQTPYYYFRAACDGSGRHLFAETFDQHLQNACP